MAFSWLSADRPETALRAILDAAAVERAVHAVTVLGLPELLEAGDRPVDEIATATGTRPELLARILRLLVAAGLFDEPSPGRFGLAPAGTQLLPNAAGSLRPLIIHRGQPYKRRPWDALVPALQSGETAFGQVFGMGMWEYLDANPEMGAAFDAAMTGLTRAMLGILPEHYPFAGTETVVDIGGGEGLLLIDILERNPNCRGVLLDQPETIKRAEKNLEAAGLAGRCRLIAGSFFDTGVEGGDIYVLKMVLHDWADEQAAIILKNVREAMPSHARVVLMERVMPERPPYPVDIALLDIMMMLELGGLERTETQWRALLAGAGLELTGITPIPASMSLIEARPGVSR